MYTKFQGTFISKKNDCRPDNQGPLTCDAGNKLITLSLEQRGAKSGCERTRPEQVHSFVRHIAVINMYLGHFGGEGLACKSGFNATTWASNFFF